MISTVVVIVLLQLEKAYATASKNLLQLLIADNDLIGHLKSVKHYFLLDQGKFEDSKLAFLFLLRSGAVNNRPLFSSSSLRAV